ncbi:hypothetical protein F2Q70_00037819 [Brassica cretica]|uniref:DNA-directed RNA polymerase n=1 Tax=Brassica cretica TaxID=69181 RepID=A0A8S9JY78_BRACR|nr:hypothetical protein F2Q70_00037819 [Brassica cretica]
MTIGQLLESLMGNGLAKMAKKKDVVPFTEVDNISKILHGSHSYQREGCERMYDGHIERPITSMISTSFP